jgi:hypothetical protein
MRQSLKKTGILYIIAATMPVLLMSGCIQIDVDAGIDADFSAYLSYHITLEINEADAQYKNILENALHQIGWHYQQELGFVVGIDSDTTPYVLTMTRRVPNRSFEQAFQSLKDMLTDEQMTIFMRVDMASQSYNRQVRYFLGAIADIPKIMSLSNIEELTPPLMERLEESIKTGEGSLTFALPASDLLSSSHETTIRDDQINMVVPLDFSGQTFFEIAAKINYLSDGTIGGTLEDIIQEQDLRRTWGLYICAAALFLIIIAMLLLIRSAFRRKKY